jgi:hypothetical protein
MSLQVSRQPLSDGMRAGTSLAGNCDCQRRRFFSSKDRWTDRAHLRADEGKTFIEAKL